MNSVPALSNSDRLNVSMKKPLPSPKTVGSTRATSSIFSLVNLKGVPPPPILQDYHCVVAKVGLQRPPVLCVLADLRVLSNQAVFEPSSKMQYSTLLSFTMDDPPMLVWGPMVEFSMRQPSAIETGPRIVLLTILVPLATWTLPLRTARFGASTDSFALLRRHAPDLTLKREQSSVNPVTYAFPTPVMRNWNESPCHTESTWYLWNLFEGWGFDLTLMSIQ